MRNWLLKLKCDVKKQNHPTVSQNFEENEKSTKRFWANVIFVYGRTCKTIISSNVCESYASVEHSAIRGMYVDPDMLDRSLERSIYQIKVYKNLPLKFPPKMAANPKETTAIIRENAADHALRPLFMRFEWTRCD